MSAGAADGGWRGASAALLVLHFAPAILVTVSGCEPCFLVHPWVSIFECVPLRVRIRAGAVENSSGLCWALRPDPIWDPTPVLGSIIGSSNIKSLDPSEDPISNGENELEVIGSMLRNLAIDLVVLG
jgi:hypothetical protein